MDVRDRFLGIKQIKSEFQPVTYHFKHHKANRRVKITENAEYAASVLEEETWGKQGHATHNRSKQQIIDHDLNFNTGDITEGEVRQYIRKTKRRKATGPDEIPIEFFKEMLDNDGSIRQLTAALNIWWNEKEEIPDDMLQARVVLIFKQGSTKDINNYRPISLLNTITKMLAAILKQRIAEKSTSTYTKHSTASGRTEARNTQST